jgi:hypothetical protein
MGARALRRLQLGAEGTAGTATAATTVWRGVGVLEDQQEQTFSEETVGNLMGYDRVYVPALLGAIKMDAVPATFEQLIHILNAGVKAVTTGAAAGTGSGKVYAFTLPTTAKNTIKTYTIEGGDDTAQERIEYAFVKSFTLDGKAGEALKMSADWVGRQVSTMAAFSTAATVPAVEEILVSMGKVYIDTYGGTFGGTQVAATVKSVNFKADTGWVIVRTLDGALTFGTIDGGAPDITLELTMLYNANAVAEKAVWKAKTTRLVRLSFQGSALTTANVYTYKTLNIDLVGMWDKFGAMGDEDGLDIVTGTFKPRYNTTAATLGALTVVNQVATLP